MVAYTGVLAPTLASLLLEAYDNLRVWEVSRNTWVLARDLKLEPILRSIENVTEALRAIEVVENARFSTFPERWCCHGDYDTGSVGLVGSSANHLYYNVFNNHELTEKEAYRLIHRDRTIIPEGHRRVWDFEAVPDGWVCDEEIVN